MAVKICIVEDDYNLANMYQYKLAHEGYAVQIAYDGQEGLKVIEAFQPDLILLDLMMPVMTGDKMLEELRATDWGGNIHVIILTNISKDEAPQQLRFLDVDRYIVKAHHTPQQIVDIIEEVLA